MDQTVVPNDPNAQNEAADVKTELVVAEFDVTDILSTIGDDVGGSIKLDIANLDEFGAEPLMLAPPEPTGQVSAFSI